MCAVMNVRKKGHNDSLNNIKRKNLDNCILKKITNISNLHVSPKVVLPYQIISDLNLFLLTFINFDIGFSFINVNILILLIYFLAF